MQDPKKRADEPSTIPAEDARAGEIVLSTRRKRAVFIGGLVGFVLLVIVFTLMAMAG